MQRKGKHFIFELFKFVRKMQWKMETLKMINITKCTYKVANGYETNIYVPFLSAVENILQLIIDLVVLAPPTSEQYSKKHNFELS